MHKVTRIAASMALSGLLLAGCPGTLGYIHGGEGSDGGGAGQDGGTGCKMACVGDVDDIVVCKCVDAGLPPDSAALPPDSTALPPDSTALPPDSTALPPDSAALPPDSATLPPDSAALPPDSAGPVLTCDPFTFGSSARPVDIVWILDQSSTMTREIEMVQDNMNDFVDAISDAKVDYRVTVLAARTGTV